MYVYVQQRGGEESWKAIPASHKKEFIAEHSPAFTTVLAVNKLVEDLEPEERSKLSYSGPLYMDWDVSTAAPDLSYVIPKFHEMLKKLQVMGLNLASCELYATGGKGFHLEVPQECFMDKIPKDGLVLNLPTIYREMVFDNYVDTVDMRVYSEGRGRMWRTPNVRRDNGHYKVPITVEEAMGMTVETYQLLTSAPRPAIEREKPKLCLDLSIAYSSAAQKVAERMKTRAKRKKDPKAKDRANVTSVQMMMDGYGLKDGVGFHQLALQITIAANTAGLSEEEMLAQSEGVIQNHQSDGNRYNTPSKRREELRRMYHYTKDNPCYEFSVGAIKTLLCHEAADLDGIPVTQDDIRESVQEANDQKEAVGTESGALAEDLDIDEYGDVASGVTLSKYGVYVDTEQGKRRATAVSFTDIHLLMSMTTGQLSAYEAMILVNGRPMGRQTIELETFQTTLQFNRFCARLGHAFNGTDAQVRGLMMRFVETAKKKGKQLYIARREGLDVVNIPYHADEDLRKQFMVWADGRGVMLDPVVAGKDLDISFQGYPDPRGLFQSDLADAPKLAEWIKEPGNKEQLKVTLQNMLTCQKPEVIAKMLGWYTACIYRMIFHKAYGQFPAMHVNGPAGSGKTQMNLTFMKLFYYNQTPVQQSPSSTVFALQQHMAASASIPLLIDEYKPHEMGVELHNKLKLLFRDAYNCRDVLKGGGTRESDDYRALHHTQLSAPFLFIAEAAEEEAAVAERVVLVTMVKPAASVQMKWLGRFHQLQRNSPLLAILGQYLAAQAINSGGVEQLRAEFDPLYSKARDRFMLTEADINNKDLPEHELRNKQGAKERTVYNFTVAAYGLGKFRKLVEAIYGSEFDEIFDELEAGIYHRMSDLQNATQAEWAKVLSMMSFMSHEGNKDLPYSLKHGEDYAEVVENGVDAVEVSLQAAYMKYRAYCRAANVRPLYAGHQQFLMGMRDCPALIRYGQGTHLERPGVYVLDTAEMLKFGIDPFNTK